jgi:hypothetical protein
MRFNSPQLAAVLKRLNGEVLITIKNLPLFAISPEETVQTYP